MGRRRRVRREREHDVVVVDVERPPGRRRDDRRAAEHEHGPGADVVAEAFHGALVDLRDHARAAVRDGDDRVRVVVAQHRLDEDDEAVRGGAGRRLRRALEVQGQGVLRLDGVGVDAQVDVAQRVHGRAPGPGPEPPLGHGARAPGARRARSWCAARSYVLRCAARSRPSHASPAGAHRLHGCTHNMTELEKSKCKLTSKSRCEAQFEDVARGRGRAPSAPRTRAPQPACPPGRSTRLRGAPAARAASA